MPDLMSAALIERGERALVAHRRSAPFAGRWMLPITVVAPDETAEEALRRHARDQFGTPLANESFVDTVYISDEADRQYVANIFRAPVDGPLRFNAEGEYDDARWLAPAEIEQLDTMPPDLRLPLVKILTEPESLHQLDWDQVADELSAQQAIPLAEQTPDDATSEALPPPDNRDAWNAISRSYQDEIFGERFEGRLMWTWALSEDDLHLLDDVAGKRILVLGCGGGQDVIALANMGAVAVGIDFSDEQIAYARRLALRRNAENTSFVVGSVDDLSRFDDDSFDGIVAAHMLNYVEHIDQALAEAARVLRSGGFFSATVHHPFNAVFADGQSLTAAHPYWRRTNDWTWNFESGASARFRQWFWTVSEWFRLLTDAGFVVERLVEPAEPPSGERYGPRDRATLVPYTLAFKARKR